jgi:hypothetical protein
MKIETRKIDVYVKQCEICGKEIKGGSEKHVDWLMKVHNLKHQD